MIWKRENIKDLTELFTDGDWIETKNQSVDGIRLIQTGNIGFGKFKPKEDKKRFISPNTFEKLKCKEIYPGDILTSRLPDPVGRSCIIPDVGERMITGVDCSIIRLKPHVDKVFFCYYQMSNEYLNEVNSRVTGTTRSRISRKNLGQIKVPIPPLREQKQIVETLDKAFEKIDKAIANIERNIENAEELFQSKLNNLFLEESDYKEVKIIETCNDKSQIVGGPFGSNLKVKDYVDIGVPILRLQNIGKGYFINKSIKYITQNKAEELKYHSFKKGDIVLAKLGIPIGKTCIVPESFEYGIVVADVVRIRPNINLVNYSFLKNFLNSDSAVRQLSSEIRGSTRPRVNISEVRNLKLRLPPIDIQIEINHKIEKLNDLRTEQVNNYNRKLGSLLELKKSILDKAFKGELTSAA